MFGKEIIEELVNPYLQSKEADEKEVLFFGISSGLTRYANTITHQNVKETNYGVTFRLILGGRIGVTSTNDISKEGLDRAFKTAIEIAKQKKPTKDFPGLPESKPPAKLNTFVETTSSAGQGERVKVVKKVFDLAKKHNLDVAGSFSSGASEIMVLNSKGVRAYQTYTSAGISNIVMHPTFSGYSSAFTRDINSINAEKLADIAVGKVLKGINPEEIEPGKYDVILEPVALCELIEWLNYIGFTSKCMEEGTGFMYEHLGEKIIGDNITIYDDAFDSKGLCTPFDFEGVPKQKVMFLENGIAKDVVYDTYSGKKANHPSTGHSLGAGGMAYGAMAMNIFMKPGDYSLEDMIKSMDRGVLVTRFHYVNGYLHTPTAKMTGMTRDGAFWVEKGEIKHGLKNMRFTDSMVRILNNVKMISKETQALPAWWGDTGAFVLPAIYVKDFEFTGKSDH